MDVEGCARDEQLDGTADQLVALVAEQRLGLGVDERDEPVRIDTDDRVRSSLEKAAELGLGTLALGDVTHRGDDEQAAVELDPRQRDLGGKLGSVAPSTGQLHAETHRTRHRSLKIRDSKLGVVTDRVGHQQLQGLPHEVVTRIPEERLRLGIHHDDAAVGDHADDCIGNRLEERRKKGAAERHPVRDRGHATGSSEVPRVSVESRGRARLRRSALARFAFSARLAEIIRVMSSPKPTSGGSGSCRGVV